MCYGPKYTENFRRAKIQAQIKKFFTLLNSCTDFKSVFLIHWILMNKCSSCHWSNQFQSFLKISGYLPQHKHEQVASGSNLYQTIGFGRPRGGMNLKGSFDPPSTLSESTETNCNFKNLLKIIETSETKKCRKIKPMPGSRLESIVFIKFLFLNYWNICDYWIWNVWFRRLNCCLFFRKNNMSIARYFLARLPCLIFNV